jgi:hypothetical protein
MTEPVLIAVSKQDTALLPALADAGGGISR